MTHRLGGVPQQGFVEQDPVLAAQVHSDLALDYLSPVSYTHLTLPTIYSV